MAAPNAAPSSDAGLKHYSQKSVKTMAAPNAAPSSGQSHHSPELRIVLIGGRQLNGNPSNKSATGNIILGKDVFDTNRRTTQSVARQQEVHGRQVTVVDTPGWWWHYPREDTPKLDQIEIKNSVYLCPPGPHAFLLVIPFDLFMHEVIVPSLQEHLKLLPEEVFSRTIVLLTAPSPCSDEDVKAKISEWPVLQWILKQCGNRRHVLCISDSQDSTQVIKLLKKIEAMVAENGGSHLPVDAASGNALREEMKALAKAASERFDAVQTQRRELKALIEGGKTLPTHLKLVMIGAQWAAKSSAGNTILGKQEFAVGHTGLRLTQYCEISHGMVKGRQLTVVDSPGWYNNHTLQDTSEMDKLELKNSVNMCSPGPHAVLLVIALATAFNASYQRAVQEHMSLFKDDVWKHTIVLFTRSDWLGVKTVEERIESEEGLQWLVEKCGNRYHVLDNTNPNDERQVEELLEKIEEMLAGSNNLYYEVDQDSVVEMEARRKDGEKMARRIRRTTERQSRMLRELFEGERPPVSDIGIVLVGREDSGKSMAGNRILFKEVFETAWLRKEFQDKRKNTKCVKHQGNLDGVKITVVEAPGWVKDTTPPDWLRDEVQRSVSMFAPGPHAFLLVVPLSKTFTDKDYEAVVEFLTPFGERVWRHCMVLFTWGEWLDSRSIEKHIASEGRPLQLLVEKCWNRYHVFNGSYFHDRGPVKELFQKIKDMIPRNKGQCFTTEGQKKKMQLPWKARKRLLTEEEWNRREEKLIDLVLKAIANEPEEPTPPSLRTAASLDLPPDMSGEVPSNFGSTTELQRVNPYVSQWLSTKAGTSDMTSGVGSMTISSANLDDLLE